MPSEPIITPPLSSIYNLTSTSSTISLPSGHRLSYSEYGSPNGTPILYMPGFPSSRIEGAGLGPTAKELGARIIAVDRPGYGDSSYQDNWTLLQHVADVSILAEILDLQRYGVLGISGGGPYALGCAHLLPAEKLKAVAIVCGLGSPDMGYWGMNWTSWAGWTFVPRWWFSRETGARLDLPFEERLARMRKTFEQEKSKMDPKDQELFGDEDFMKMHLVRSQEVYKHGTAAMSRDFRVLNSDFGFRIEDIRKDLPVMLWHGRLDDMVPLQHAEKVKCRIGDSASLKITDDTHASIWRGQMREYMEELVKAVEA